MRTDHDLPPDQRVAIRKARKKIAIGVSIVLPGASGVIIPYRLFIVLIRIFVVARGFL